jgi:hypothetical protein
VPADIYLVNTYVRGLYLPAGKHYVLFSFRPASLRAGVAIATTAHFVIWILVGLGWWLTQKGKKKGTLSKP